MNWKAEHIKTIQSFLSFINLQSTNFVLKGDTALSACYNFNRFSEDINLNSTDKNFTSFVDEYCKHNNYEYCVDKDTSLMKRCFINYGNAEKLLKVEVSYRRKEILQNETTVINGIRVYNIDNLCAMKTTAYSSKGKLNDLYDICFICNNYYNQLSDTTISVLRNAIEYKGIEHFDYIVQTQQDELIDANKLAYDLLETYNLLGLLYGKEEKQIISAYIDKIN